MSEIGIVMQKLPLRLKKMITSPDPVERKAAARELAGYPGEESLAYLIRMLSDGQTEVVCAASHSIVSIGTREAVDAMIPLLRSEDVALRNLAIEIISRIGSTAAPQVTALLNDPDMDVQKFAVDILKSMKSPETVDSLIRTLYSENVNIAGDAAEILGDIGNPRAIYALTQCLEREPWLKCAALRALGKIGGEDALRAVLSISPDEEGLVLFCAVTALGSIGDKRGLDYLIGLLDKKYPSLESAVIQALESILKNADTNTIEKAKSALQPDKLLPLLDKGNTGVVRSVIRLMGFFKEKRSVEKLVGLYTEENTPLFGDIEEALVNINPKRIDDIRSIIKNKLEPDSVKISAVRLIKRIGNPSAADLLLESLEKGWRELKIEVMDALAALKHKPAIGSLHKLLKDEDEEIKTAAIKALETFCDGTSISLLINLSANKSEAVRKTAAISLRKYDLKERKQDIRKFLKKTDSELICFGLEMIPENLLPEFEEDIFLFIVNEQENVRICAIEQAGLLGTRRAFEMIVQALSDKTPQVRLAVIRGLEHYQGENIGKHLIHVLASDPDEWNRYEAVQIIGRLGLEELLEQMVPQLDNAPDIVKAGIFDVLGQLGTKQHLDVVKPYTESANVILKNAAEKAAEKLKIGGTPSAC